jgi:hypothetical protein
MQMITPNEFWLALHAATEAYDAEGLTPEERLANIMNQFHKMPPTVQRSLVIQLERFVAHAGDLIAAARSSAAAPNVERQPAAPRGRVG